MVRPSPTNKETRQHIRVYLRCRPMNTSEKKKNNHNVIDIKSENEVTVKDSGNNRFSKTFTFDRVFGSQSCQIDVYKSVVLPLIDEVLMGYNCTVFAYGQTGTGKTFTMEGEKTSDQLSWDEEPLAGIIPRTLHQIFDEMTNNNAEFSVRVSFLELYNEELFDLLTPVSDTNRLRIYEDSTKKGSVVIQGLEEISVHSKDEVYSILERGAQKRQTAATMMNSHSSRSHSVFSVTVNIKENTDDGEELIKTGKLNLVDLAGSENIGKSGAVEKRAREAGNINQSLLTLGRVIAALVERAPHIPYRESKLTRLLQDSLGGRTKTSIIATISPASSNLDETLSTLDYAHRAKNITNKPEINRKLTKRALIKEYTEEIERLRKDLFAARNKDGFFIDEDNYKSMITQIETQTEKIKAKFSQIEILQQEVETIQQLFETTSGELNKERKFRKDTQNELSLTKDVLKESITDRDEKQYLLHHHIKTENNLSSQAVKLKSVANQSTTEISQLHAKLDRVKSVEKSNCGIKKEFRTNYLEQLVTMEDSLNMFHQGFDKFCVNHNDDLKIKSQELNQQCSNACGYLSNAKKRQEDLLANFKAASNQRENIILKSTCEHVDKMSILQDKSVELVQEFMKDDWLIAYSNVVDIVKQQQTLIKQLVGDCFYQVDQSKKRVEGYVHNAHSSLNELKTTVEDLLEVQNTSYKGISENFQSLDNLRRCSSNSIQALILSSVKSILQTEFEKFNSLNDEKISSATKDIDESNQAIWTKGKQISSLVNKSEESAKNLLKGSNEDGNKISENVECKCSDASQLYSDILDQIESTNASVTSLKKKYVQLKVNATNIQTTFAENLQHQTNEVGTYKAATIEELNNEIKIQEGHVNKELASIMSIDLQKTSRYEDELLGYKDYSLQWKDEMVNALKLRDEDISKLFDEHLKKDISTGTTPKKHDFTYPQELAATSPHDRLLRRFRQNMNINLGAALPIPEESFNEADSSEKSMDAKYESDLETSKNASRGYSSDSEGTKENSFIVPSKLPRAKHYSSLNSLADKPKEKKKQTTRQPFGLKQEF